ncbi:hypothetical protein Pcinc_009703 [Petrolisthes cinctipes]|uniref:Uncharacterized protein n=1 Tax=Petrolisthes cinctipes TaxID=88211 RepID=A0AAE1G6U7_PETCI|nr:hypothetical protein Pcinc_009703 [Petrolisthes cinctipes]
MELEAKEEKHPDMPIIFTDNMELDEVKEDNGNDSWLESSDDDSDVGPKQDKEDSGNDSWLESSDDDSDVGPKQVKEDSGNDSWLESSDDDSDVGP